jgi:hypothetical protein
VIVTQTYRDLNLRTDRDYVIQMPAVALSGKGGLKINGGRNVVLVGGAISISDQSSTATGEERRGLLLQGQTGTVHIEGLQLSGYDLSEGIQIAAPQAIVQIQNVRVERLRARDSINFTDNHPDIIQTWGGVRELRVDRLTGITDFQGFLLKADTGAIGSVDLRRVNITGTSTHGYLFSSFGTFPVQVQDVWAVSQNLNKEWKHNFLPVPTSVPWSAVKSGTPPGGDYVPRGVPGPAYVSPYPHVKPSAPSLTINDVKVAEPKAGETRTAWFTITLSKPTSAKVWINYSTKNATAIAPGDYTSVSGTVILNPDQRSVAVGVPIRYDGLSEPSEGFVMTLHGPINAVVNDGWGNGYIRDY